MSGRTRAWLAPAGVGSARGQGGRSYRGSACARQHRLPARCRTRAAAPAVGATAHADDVQRRRWRSEGKGRGLGHPFEKRMIIPL
ncbi:hypothetical protein BHE74_00049375 [Ensete ventricosum]|nr:hypothetical protein BHE74_00049375 [Ensete ventricosum]